MQPVRLEKFHLFWILAIGLSILLTAIMVRDITKPFVEMHSWGHAHDAWVARSHVKYGLGYTKGFDTFAVGNPPAANPTRYLDHPVLFTLINAAVMYALGINEWSMRAVNIICTIIALLLFLKILRHLFDDATSLLAGLFFCLFPLIAFYGVNMWLYPLALLAYWCYLSLIGALKDSAVKKWHKPVLAIAIFLAIQMTWEGFFFAMAMGIHYVCHCIHKRKRPDGSLLLILAIAPFASLALDFIVLAAGQNWDFKRLFELARIRSSSGELGNALTWTVWFARFVEHAFTNFSLPVTLRRYQEKHSPPLLDKIQPVLAFLYAGILPAYPAERHVIPTSILGKADGSFYGDCSGAGGNDSLRHRKKVEIRSGGYRLRNFDNTALCRLCLWNQLLLRHQVAEPEANRDVQIPEL
jgi:hypothetical protein